MTVNYSANNQRFHCDVAVAINDNPRVFKQLLRLAFEQAELEIVFEYERRLASIGRWSPERELAQQYQSRTHRFRRRARWFGRHAAFTSFRTAA